MERGWDEESKSGPFGSTASTAATPLLERASPVLLLPHIQPSESPDHRVPSPRVGNMVVDIRTRGSESIRAPKGHKAAVGLYGGFVGLWGWPP